MEGKRRVKLVGEVRSYRVLWALVRFCFQVYWKSTLGFLCVVAVGGAEKVILKKRSLWLLPRQWLLYREKVG